MLDMNGDGKLHVLFGGTKIVQHTAPPKASHSGAAPMGIIRGDYLFSTLFYFSVSYLLLPFFLLLLLCFPPSPAPLPILLPAPSLSPSLSLSLFFSLQLPITTAWPSSFATVSAHRKAASWRQFSTAWNESLRTIWKLFSSSSSSSFLQLLLRPTFGSTVLMLSSSNFISSCLKVDVAVYKSSVAVIIKEFTR